MLNKLESNRYLIGLILSKVLRKLFSTRIVNISLSKDGFLCDFISKTNISTKDFDNINQTIQYIINTNQISFDHNTDIANIEKYFESSYLNKIKNRDSIKSVIWANYHTPILEEMKISSDLKSSTYFKLLNVSGLHEDITQKSGQSLQRIKGTLWLTQKDLNNYITSLQEAEDKSHVKIGSKLDLFHINDYAIGEIFWHPKGWVLYSIIMNYIRDKLKEHDYQEVNTPILLDSALWEKSGHLSKFLNNMYMAKPASIIDNTESQKDLTIIKPMNCPAHVEIFKSKIRSYKDLPIKLSEFGKCHRYESSGSLNGLMRVRSMVQDDAHIFCTEEQMQTESYKFCKLLQEVYQDFGFNNIKIKLATRPKLRAGSNHVWDVAEQALKDMLIKLNIDFTLNIGEGAFYGPKIEFVLTDALSRDWQCGTLQVDLVLPERLGAFYIDKKGDKQHPVMLHRAILGSFERFIGILLEHYSGKLPIWLSPIQVIILTITDHTSEYAKSIRNTLLKHDIRTEIDCTNNRISQKIHTTRNQCIPVMLIVGKKELANNIITIKIGSLEKSQSLNKVIEIIKNYK